VGGGVPLLWWPHVPRMPPGALRALPGGSAHRGPGFGWAEVVFITSVSCSGVCFRFPFCSSWQPPNSWGNVNSMNVLGMVRKPHLRLSPVVTNIFNRPGRSQSPKFPRSLPPIHSCLAMAAAPQRGASGGALVPVQGLRGDLTLPPPIHRLKRAPPSPLLARSRGQELKSSQETACAAHLVPAADAEPVPVTRMPTAEAPPAAGASPHQSHRNPPAIFK